MRNTPTTGRGRPARARWEAPATAAWTVAIEALAIPADQGADPTLRSVLGAAAVRYARGERSPSAETLRQVDCVAPCASLFFGSALWMLLDASSLGHVQGVTLRELAPPRFAAEWGIPRQGEAIFWRPTAPLQKRLADLRKWMNHEIRDCLDPRRNPNPLDGMVALAWLLHETVALQDRGGFDRCVREIISYQWLFVGHWNSCLVFSDHRVRRILMLLVLEIDQRVGGVTRIAKTAKDLRDLLTDSASENPWWASRFARLE